MIKLELALYAPWTRKQVIRIYYAVYEQNPNYKIHQTQVKKITAQQYTVYKLQPKQ